MNNVINLKKFICNKNFLLKVLCYFLVILLVFFGCFIFGAIESNALAVTLTVGAVLLLTTALTAIGVTVANNDSANAVANNVYNKLDEKHQAEIEQASLGLTGAASVVEFTADWWADFMTTSVGTFGYQSVSDVTTLDVGSLSTAEYLMQNGINLGSTTSFATPRDCQYIYNCGSITTGMLGSQVIKDTFSYLSFTDDMVISDKTAYYYLSNSSSLSLVKPTGFSDRTVFNVSYGKGIANHELDFWFSSSSIFDNNTNFIYGSDFYNLTNFNTNTRTFQLVSSSTGAVLGRDVAIPNQVCDDLGIWDINTFLPWLLGDDIPTVGIDTDYFPTSDTDTWCDDVSTGTIPGTIAVPGSIDNLLPGVDTGDVVVTPDWVRDGVADAPIEQPTDTPIDVPTDIVIDDSIDIADIIQDKIPAVDKLYNLFDNFSNANSRGFHFEFVFRKKTYVIDCAFYEPYRFYVRGALSWLFIIATFLACFKLFRSCFGISFSGGEGENDE